MTRFAGLPSLAFVPPVLPDELLYSWLGRLVALNALSSPRAYLLQLFETKDIVPGVDLPTRLSSLQRILGESSPFDHADQMIEVATLFPYHRSFLILKRAAAARDILLNGDGKGLKTLIGRVANRFGASPSLRFCPACIERDISTHGTSYWHRSHHLPGVACCAEHALNLVFHSSPSISADKQRLVLTPGVCFAAHVPADPPQVRFAEMSRELLHAGLPPTDPGDLQAAYVAAIRRSGWVCGGGRLDHGALIRAIRSYFNDFESLVHRERLLAPCGQPLAWLRTLWQRPQRASHPICHLLLIDFLFGSLKQFRVALQERIDMEPACRVAAPVGQPQATLNKTPQQSGHQGPH